MKPILRPTTGPDDWRSFLAEPDKQWKLGHSAHALAHRWESACGLPANVQAVLGTSSRFREFELLLAIPELRVDLPGGQRASQTDLWLLGRQSDGLVSVAVEGKVAESFGPTLAEWQVEASPGKSERLGYLLDVLRLKSPLPPAIRYQLLHRTASAILLAKRFHAAHSLMLVHSFSPEDASIADYRAFAALLGVAQSGEGVLEIPGHQSPTLALAWVRDVAPNA